MAELLDKDSWNLSTADLIQQVAAYIWLSKGDEHKDMYKLVTGARVAHELFNRFSQQRNIEQFESECIIGICDYIKKHPKASEKDLATEVQKQIELFKNKVETL